jgi:hypothetical protein
MKTPTCFIRTFASACLISTSLFAGDSILPGTPRPLRYTPQGTDFVIENGSRFFNRPLYGGNAGFRIEAGDRPEFALFLPGRGGNLRFAVFPEGGNANPLWLHDAKSITARYRPGSMLYEIRDPLLGDAAISLTAIPLAPREGFAIRIESTRPVTLFWAFGGANGDTGRRNGDMGGERMPLGEFFKLRPEDCRDHRFQATASGFTLPVKNGTLVGLAAPGTRLSLGDATQLASPALLRESAGKPTDTPLQLGELQLAASTPSFLAIDLVRPKQKPSLRAEDLPTAFAEAEAHRAALAGRLTVETPDPFLNSAAAALSVAGDAIWDETREAYMHGAVSWRVKLLGWRAAYAGDALGWHDRTRRHIDGFAKLQNTSPIPDEIPPADEKFNLARNETALHSNGDFSSTKPNHYNMNLVAVDTFFRHLLWTGDLAFAAEMWPVIERHLARERRLFRRPFGPEKLPLYEAYACIWASDELIYHGGGATHSTAYNLWHNQMAARLATLLGKDPAPYQKEAALIREAMRRKLWLPEEGWYAEFRDFLGNQAAHPSPALWTFYHALDSDAATPMEAWQMTRFVDTALPKIPIEGPGTPPGNFNLPTTNWMPYRWSINNVALAESTHTALASWQAGRPEIAMPLLKGALLDAMFTGACPGNVGMTAPSDIFSGEQYRDFADAVGITARTFVEGLFGIHPDQLSGVLRIRPGFPADWENARIRHPGIHLAFKREGLRESWAIESKLAKPMTLVLETAAHRDGIASVTVNGKPATWKALPETTGHPRIAITAPPSPRQVVIIEWRGNPPTTLAPTLQTLDGDLAVTTGPAKILAVADPQNVLENPTHTDHEVKATSTGTPGHRSAFLQLKQGDLTWWQPLAFELRAATEFIPAATQDSAHLRFTLRNNTREDWSADATVLLAGEKIPMRVALPAGKDSAEIALPAAGLPPGSHPVTVRLGTQRSITGTITNWKIDSRLSSPRWETIDLTKHFNDPLTRIFTNEYRSPRSPFCSLAIPKQGIGGWCYYSVQGDIDDSGLRAAAGKNDGIFQTALGIPFRTPGPGETPNIIFTSQWDNYPREVTLPLSGRSSRAALLMAGSTNAMQCRFDNGEIVVTYTDGTTTTLTLHSPVNWWPIEQDFHIDTFAFSRPEPVPPRLDLKTAKLRVMNPSDCQSRGAVIPGGAATILDLPLDPSKDLASLTLRTSANEVVIGLMAITLARSAIP